MKNGRNMNKLLTMLYGQLLSNNHNVLDKYETILKMLLSIRYRNFELAKITFL